MPNITKPFDSYTLQVTSGASTKASVTCFNGREQVGMLIFRDTTSLPEPWHQQLNAFDRLFLYYHIREFDSVMDILRNEKPLKLYFNPGGKWGCVSTSSLEPVGEEERQATARSIG
jgi:hypothetical protein